MIVPDLAELSALRGAARGLSLRAQPPRDGATAGRSPQRAARARPGIRRGAGSTRPAMMRATSTGASRHGAAYRTPNCSVRSANARSGWSPTCIPACSSAAGASSNPRCCCAAAAMLAWVAATGGDRVGAVIAGGNRAPRIFPPRAREAGVLPVLQALIEAQPRAPGTPAPGGLLGALTTLRRLLHPGSLILLLSDFADFDPQTENILASASTHSECRLLRVTDPLESSGLPPGSYHVGLPGRLAVARWRRHSRHMAAAWKAREQQLNDLSMRLNLPLSNLNTHDAVIERVVALLKEPAWAA